MTRISRPQVSTQELGSGYVPALDGLRAVAVLAVMVYHLHVATWFGGAAGVDVFFVLSGFLIASILLRDITVRGRVRYARFYVRRASRLLPSLVMLLALTVPVAVFLGVAQNGIVPAALAAFFYLTPVTRLLADFDPIFEHTWTLAAEEYFYLLLPMLLVLLHRWGMSRRMMRWAFTACATLLYLTYAILFSMGIEISMLRAAGLAVGVAFALRSPDKAAVSRSIVPVAGAIVVLIALVFGRMPGALWLTWPCVAVGTAFMITGVMQGRPWLNVPLGARPMRYIGSISYELYLWHYVVFVLGERLSDWPPLALGWITVPTSFVFAAASHHVAARVKERVNSRFDRTQEPVR